MSRKKANIRAKPVKAPTPADGKFHLIKSKYAANSLSKALDSGQIMEDDKLLVEKHVAWLGRSNISVVRLNKITYHHAGCSGRKSAQESENVEQIFHLFVQAIWLTIYDKLLALNRNEEN